MRVDEACVHPAAADANSPCVTFANLAATRFRIRPKRCNLRPYRQHLLQTILAEMGVFGQDQVFRSSLKE